MDPRQCLNDAEQALLDGDMIEAKEILKDYLEWRDKGGFISDRMDAQAKRIGRDLGYNERSILWTMLSNRPN